LSDIVVQLIVIKVRIKKSDLVWDEWNIEHIAKHHVVRAEVEQIFARAVRAKKSYKDRLIVFGKTKSRRLLAVVLEKEVRGYYVLSGRVASRKERRDLLK